MVVCAHCKGVCYEQKDRLTLENLLKGKGKQVMQLYLNEQTMSERKPWSWTKRNIVGDFGERTAEYLGL